jgi:uncharacterized OsmC-like protein
MMPSEKGPLGQADRGPATYRSYVKLSYEGVDVTARLPELDQPVTFGMHDAIAAHYGIQQGSYEPRPATLDYLVGAIAGCMTGTFGDALAARGVVFDSLSATACGSIDDQRGVLVLRAVEIEYFLNADAEFAEAIERAHAVHARGCPVHRSIEDCIEVSTSLTRLEQGGS